MKLAGRFAVPGEVDPKLPTRDDSSEAAFVVAQPARGEKVLYERLTNVATWDSRP